MLKRPEISRNQKISQEEKLRLLNILSLLPNDLYRIVLEYTLNREYNTKPVQVWEIGTQTYGIISNRELLYICNKYHNSILIYNLQGQKIEQKSSLSFITPTDIDFDQNGFYIIDHENVSICNLQFELLSYFQIPSSLYCYSHLKADNGILYVTISGIHWVYVYKENGEIKTWIGPNNPSIKEAEFNDPSGITVNEQYIFICDYENNRVQILLKNKNYLFYKQFGKKGKENAEFMWPSSIYYWEDVVFVGDNVSVQLFTNESIFIQRLGHNDYGSDCGKFRLAWGICIICDCLYVSDTDNRRIQVFRVKDQEH